MPGLIPQDFLDDLLDRVDIVDIVDSRVKLKKTGKNYSACCPFHDEKTPSFTVSPDKQFYYCFGCGATGTALTFLLEFEHLPFPDAVEQLARGVGLEVPREATAEKPRDQQRKALYTILSAANDYFQKQLREHSARHHATNYLKRRGLSGAIARDFGIGYAPPGWDSLLRELGGSEPQLRHLVDSGMLIERPEDGRRYDRFRNRITFPIRDSRGRVVGFGGRVLDDGKPKYLNSPETPVFQKSLELYGLYEARQANRQLQRLLVVEGYMDVLALAQFDIRYAVATLGTACGEEHLIRVFKHTQELVFCFDGDQAGRTAARRALENSLPIMEDGRQIRFLFLPEGEDPDSLVRQVGAGKFENMIDHAVPMEEFLFDSLADGIDLRSMEGRARYCKVAVPLLHRLPNGVFRELMFDHLAQRTGLSRASLLELVNHPPEAEAAPDPVGRPPETPRQIETRQTDTPASRFSVQTENPPPPFHQDHTRVAVRLTPARLLCALLLLHPNLAAETPETPAIGSSADPDLRQFTELLDFLRQRPGYTLNRTLGYWRGLHGEQASDALAEIAATEVLYEARNRKESAFNAREEYLECLARVERKLQRHAQEQAIAKLQAKNFAELSEDEKQQIRKFHADRSTKPTV